MSVLAVGSSSTYQTSSFASAESASTSCCFSKDPFFLFPMDFDQSLASYALVSHAQENKDSPLLDTCSIPFWPCLPSIAITKEKESDPFELHPAIKTHVEKTARQIEEEEKQNVKVEEEEEEREKEIGTEDETALDLLTAVAAPPSPSEEQAEQHEEALLAAALQQQEVQDDELLSLCPPKKKVKKVVASKEKEEKGVGTGKAKGKGGGVGKNRRGKNEDDEDWVPSSLPQEGTEKRKDVKVEGEAEIDKEKVEHEDDLLELEMDDDEDYLESSTLSSSSPASSSSSSRRRARTSDASGIKRPWTAEEDKILLSLVNKYGTGKWTMLAQHLPGRVGKQLRERYTNHLSDSISKEPWSAEEDRILFEKVAKFGHQWATITKYLPGRTDNSVKNRFYSKARKMNREKERAAQVPMSGSSEDKNP